LFFKGLLLLILFSLTQCHTAKETPPSAQPSVAPTQKTNETNKNSAEGIAPGNCRLIASVIKIDSSLNTEDPESPCAKGSCLALVKIQNVLAYGSAFPSDVAEGAEINLFFPNTLTPHFLGIKSSSPDLKNGDLFQALVEARMHPLSGHLFIVNDYKIK
jgi:hypothetical protein